MYTRILVPLDGSATAEKVLPHSRLLARYLKLPVDLLKVIDVAELGQRISHQTAQFLNTFVEKMEEASEEYLRVTADTFADTVVKCTVLKGIPAETIIDKAAEDPGTLVSMA